MTKALEGDIFEEIYTKSIIFALLIVVCMCIGTVFLAPLYKLILDSINSPIRFLTEDYDGGKLNSPRGLLGLSALLFLRLPGLKGENSYKNPFRVDCWLSFIIMSCVSSLLSTTHLMFSPVGAMLTYMTVLPMYVATVLAVKLLYRYNCNIVTILS